MEKKATASHQRFQAQPISHNKSYNILKESTHKLHLKNKKETYWIWPRQYQRIKYLFIMAYDCQVLPGMSQTIFFVLGSAQCALTAHSMRFG